MSGDRTWQPLRTNNRDGRLPIPMLLVEREKWGLRIDASHFGYLSKIGLAVSGNERPICGRSDALMVKPNLSEGLLAGCQTHQSPD